MRSFLLLLLFSLIAQPLLAQHEGHGDHMQRPDPLAPQGENLQVPPTWTVRLDHADHNAVIGADSTADIFFVNMTPGWHITSGPAGVYYHPASTAEGTYRAEMLVHLFDPGERNEAFGLFIGGVDLEGDGIAYDYFLIRNSGEYLIKRREGSDTSVIQNWTKHDGIETFAEGDGTTATNRLAVEVGAENVDFYINDEKVESHPRSHIRTDGIVGLRINHALNLHVEDFKVQ